jgi:xanthine dehydrogenase accessory factor
MLEHDELPVPRTAPPSEVMRVALRHLDLGEPVVVATVLERRGSAPSTPGQKLALLSERRAVGTVGGGAVEYRVLEAMRELMRVGAGEPVVESFSLGSSIGMCCGGAVKILLEPLVPALTVLVVGAGHIGATLAPMLVSLGFRLVLIDGREEMVGEDRVVPQERLQFLCADHDDPQVAHAVGACHQRAAALVMTHDHQLDREAIKWALAEDFALVGGVGSRAKLARTQTWLETRGIDVADIERIKMPLGLDIGARSPAEIAISIAGELIEWRAALLGTRRRARGAVESMPDLAVEAD